MQIVPSPPFERELKFLIKKHPSLIKKMKVLNQELLKNPYKGTSLGKSCYKIRIPLESGKSGGARLITCIRVVEEQIHLVTIFEKNEKENISDKELKERLKHL
jgi:hypothetical protein